jgi:hypothetical protein
MTIEKIMSEVEAEYGMGGLRAGVYGDFARDVAERYAAQLKAENEQLKATLATERLSGFAAAFYQIAEAVGVKGARPATPQQVFEGEILPAIRAAVRDAERYRFIRQDVKRSGYALIPDESDMDARVDAAMSKEASHE